jgi:hypothetical protein
LRSRRPALIEEVQKRAGLRLDLARRVVSRVIDRREANLGMGTTSQASPRSSGVPAPRMRGKRNPKCTPVSTSAAAGARSGRTTVAGFTRQSGRHGRRPLERGESGPPDPESRHCRGGAAEWTSGSRFAASWAASTPGSWLGKHRREDRYPPRRRQVSDQFLGSRSGGSALARGLRGWVPSDPEGLDGPTDPANTDLRVALGDQMLDLPHPLEGDVDQQHHLAML